MKRLVALILVCIICMTTAYAAEWAEGLSPAKPSNLKPEVNLSETVGYWLPYPRSGLTAERFCDVLELYMPNPDIELGKGTATLWNADGEVAVVDFSNPDQVELRNLEEVELEDLHWGSGVCIEMHLPISLKFDESYYVTMEEGTLTGKGGTPKSMAIPYSDKVSLEEQYWTPAVVGDFGISGLYYCAAAEAPEAEKAEEAGEPAEEGEVAEAVEPEEEEEEEEEGDIEPKYNPEKGDELHFRVVLGGDAVTAVMYSENDSVHFDTVEYTKSHRVTGTITGDDMNWGVVFLDEKGDVVDYISFGGYEDAE